MRIAILSAIQDIPGAEGSKRAFRRFAGRTILSHQVDCALDLECDAICCLVSGLGQDVIESQHRAEMAGIRFQAVENPRRLSGMIKADDAVIVIADGLLPEGQVLVESLSRNRGVLTFPAELAVPRGYERLDAKSAWAGAIGLRGDAIERLADLPEDTDIASALVRIALQTGVGQVPLDPQLVSASDWLLLEEREVFSERERRWISGRADPVSFAAPGKAIAERVGIRLGKDIVGTRFERAPLITGVAAGVFAALAGSMGHSAIALGLALLMTVCLPMAGVIRQIGRIEKRRKHRLSIGASTRAAADLLLVGLLAQATPTSDTEWMRLFVPAMLIGSLRIAEHASKRNIASLFGDRIILMLGAIAAYRFEVIQPVLAALTALTVGAMLLMVHRDELTEH